MSNDQIAAFIGRHVEAWNRHDATALCANHAENGVIISPMFGRVEGREQICRTYAGLFTAFPDWNLRYEAPVMDGNRVAVAFSVTATHTGEFMGLAGSGKRCGFEGASLFQIASGPLIAEERRFYDFTGFLAQLGVLRLREAR